MQYLDTMFVLFVCIYNTFYWIYKNRYNYIYWCVCFTKFNVCVSGCTVPGKLQYNINMGIALL